MNRYLLSVIQPDGDPPGPEILDPIMRNVEILNDELRAAGAWVFAGSLTPVTSATVVRYDDGKYLTTDGPYAEGKEHIGGFCIIQAPDLDAALAWARRAAWATTLPIEVRAFAHEH